MITLIPYRSGDHGPIIFSDSLSAGRCRSVDSGRLWSTYTGFQCALAYTCWDCYCCKIEEAQYDDYHAHKLEIISREG